MKNSDFITGRVPITKEEVRVVSIMKLDLVNAKRFIDVGAGTGSVSVEAAYNYPNLEVIPTSKVLNAGIGHIEETAGIGESGNCVLCRSEEQHV